MEPEWFNNFFVSFIAAVECNCGPYSVDDIVCQYLHEEMSLDKNADLKKEIGEVFLKIYIFI